MATLKNLTINDTGYLQIPSGTIAQRPASPSQGMIRYNTDLKENEYYNGTSWITGTGDNSIVSSGLVLWLDAGLSSSYPGSGTTWTDLSGGGNNGTLTNGPTYNSSNGGILVFDGVDDRVECGTFSLSYLTISTWVYKTSSATDQGICRKQNGWAVSQYNGTLQVAPGTSWAFYDTGYTIPLNTWVNIVYTYSGTGTTGSQTVYVNGSNIYSSSAGSGAISANSNAVRIGYDDNNWFWGGRIAQTQIYNKALTAAEVQQNYQALVHRFRTVPYGFLSSTTFNVPQTGSYIIHAVGGGGAAGASWWGNFYGSGGGSGYYSQTTVNLTQGESLSINIGAGGPGATWNNSGSAGGTTTVVRSGTTILTANGGGVGGNGVGGNGGSGGGPGAANSNFTPGQGGYNGSNGQNAAGTGGTGQLGVVYGSGSIPFIPPGGSGSYIGGANTWAGIYGFGAGAQAGNNQDGIAAGGGAGGGTWAQPAKSGKSGLVVIYGPL